MGVLLSQCWLVFLVVGMVASTCGGVRGSLSVAFFGRWILPDSSALGAGLPGLLGSCSTPDSERAFTFGSFSLLGIHLRPRLLP